MALEFIEHLNFFDEHDLRSLLQGLLDTLHISYVGFKMHLACLFYSPNMDYVRNIFKTSL